MMCGLQGSGKTTHSAKLAKLLKKEGHRPLLAACDIYRPAAINQLQVVGQKADVKVFEMGQISPVTIAGEALKYAKDYGHDILIIDTAGRLHVDEALMQELKDIKALTNPDEIMLVVDAMTGQDAVNVAKAFDEAVGITSVHVKAGFRYKRRCGAVRALSYRQAYQVRRYGRKTGRFRAVPPGENGFPYPGNGRCAHPHREG